MTASVVVVFLVVYLGMFLGRLPRLRLDRTGVALLGAIAILGTGALTLDEAIDAVDAPTILLLFGLMVVSAQLRLGGFYARVTRGLATAALSPAALLGALVAAVGALAAVFSNDIICLATAPVLADLCRRRRLDPVPFLLALACAANVGSAATLIGNPQNMLIGQVLRMSFRGYAAEAAVPVLLGLGATWAVIARQSRGRWAAAGAADPAAGTGAEEPEFDAWQTLKGLGVAALVLAAFLFSAWPREIVALAGAGLLLTSRKLHSRQMLGMVDWQLLVLFAGLFIVNHALQATGAVAGAVAALAEHGLDPGLPPVLFALTVLLSNTVSNVPAVMLLLPLSASRQAGAILALASTLAGNLLVVGSIANIIVVEAAKGGGILLDWRRHARTGVPVTLITLAIAAAWLWIRSA